MTVIDGVTVIARITRLLEPLFSEIILAGWPAGDPLPAGVVYVSDNYHRIGPLAGIEAALRVARSPLLFVVGGDMPWLSAELIGEQITDYRRRPAPIHAIRTGGVAEPLHAIYSREIHPLMVRFIESGAGNAIIDFHKEAGALYYDIEATGERRRALSSINRPEDLNPPSGFFHTFGNNPN